MLANNDKLVSLHHMTFGYRTCLLNTTFADTMCDKFTLKFMVKGAQTFPMFGFGYAYSSIDKLDSDSGLGRGFNADYSVGVYLDPNQNKLEAFPNYTCDRQLNWGSFSNFGNSDIIELSFDFLKDKMDIYHNNNFVDYVSLHYKRQTPKNTLFMRIIEDSDEELVDNDCKGIIPGVCLDTNEISIELLECVFE